MAPPKKQKTLQMKEKRNSSSADLKYSKVTHCIFDLDGTLLDTERVYCKMLQQSVKEYGHSFSEDFELNLHGLQNRQMCEILCRDLHLPITVNELVKKVQEQMPKFLPLAPLKPGAMQLLKHLRDSKIPIALATNSTETQVKWSSEAKPELFAMFNHMVFVSDPCIKEGKPSPQIYIVTAARFPDQPPPERCLVFEDSFVGVLAAKEAGMQRNTYLLLLWECVNEIATRWCYDKLKRGNDTLDSTYSKVVMIPEMKLDDKWKSQATVVLQSLTEFKPEEFGLPPFPNNQTSLNRKTLQKNRTVVDNAAAERVTLMNKNTKTTISIMENDKKKFYFKKPCYKNYVRPKFEKEIQNTDEVEIRPSHTKKHTFPADLCPVCLDVIDKHNVKVTFPPNQPLVFGGLGVDNRKIKRHELFYENIHLDSDILRKNPDSDFFPLPDLAHGLDELVKRNCAVIDKKHAIEPCYLFETKDFSVFKCPSNTTLDNLAISHLSPKCLDVENKNSLSSPPPMLAQQMIPCKIHANHVRKARKSGHFSLNKEFSLEHYLSERRKRSLTAMKVLEAANNPAMYSKYYFEHRPLHTSGHRLDALATKNQRRQKKIFYNEDIYKGILEKASIMDTYQQ